MVRSIALAVARSVFMALLLFLGLAFVARYAGAPTLKLYIQTGIGDCTRLPILCTIPEGAVREVPANKAYLKELVEYQFPKLKIRLPKTFTVINERLHKVYYKKQKRKETGQVAYCMRESPNFFIGLFPQVAGKEVHTDYDFLKRTMYGQTENIKNLMDAFFVIMKSIFTPGMGAQENVHIVEFVNDTCKGFVTYNLTPTFNYFDCNIVYNEGGDFFKIYIKDKGATLDIDKVLLILTTVQKGQ